MLLKMCPGSPSFEEHFHCLDGLDRFSTDMEAMSIAADDQSITGSGLDTCGSHSQETKKEKRQAQQEETETPKKKRVRKGRVKIKSPEVVLKLKTSRRQRANDRERNRMHGLNEALEVLRTTLPNSMDAKMTKIETLRYACNYISALAASVKLLEQNKGKPDFGNVLPNPDDYVFMLNFKYELGNSLDDTQSNSPCPLTPMSRSDCDNDFADHPQNREHHSEGGILQAQSKNNQISFDMKFMDTSANTNTNSFLFSDQSIFQQLSNQYKNMKQDHELENNHQDSFQIFASSQNKNINSPCEEMLASMGSGCGSFLHSNFSTVQPVAALPITHNTPPTSPENKQPCTLRHQKQQQQCAAPILSRLSQSSHTNNFLQHHKHQFSNDHQLPNILDHHSTNFPTINQHLSQSTNPMIYAQYL